MAAVDLAGVEVVDDHCHPYRVADLVARDPSEFEARSTFLGTCFMSSRMSDPALWKRVVGLADSNIFALVLRRWLAEFLGCEPTKEAVAAARAQALRQDPVGYTKGLLADQRVVAVLSDDGYPQPAIPREEFERSLGVDVYRVARLEPWIVAHREEGWDGLVGVVEDDVDRAASDPRCVAYKSIIAYRTGLDVGDPSAREAAQAFERWRADGWRESREHAKPARDFLLRRALAIARRHDRPFHIHCGGGDADVLLPHARPQDLFGLLVDHADQPIVLVHAGDPWVAEAGYVAAVLPNVFLDLSAVVPWSWSGIDWVLETVIGMVPTDKLLHGSDEASEPEVFWLGARIAREALERVLGRLVERDHLTRGQAERIGAGVLAGNTRRLHGIAGSTA